jgi:hypothetical protein
VSETVCPSQDLSCDINIVPYLPHARTVESWKPQNMHATVELRVFIARCQATVSAPMKSLSGSHATCPRHDIPDSTIGTM